MVVADAAEGAEADGDGLPAAAEGDVGDVEVDEEVGVGDGAVDLDLKAAVGLAEED